MSLLLLATFAASVSAHGYVQGIVAGGTYYTGYSPSFQYQSPPPTVIGWSDPEDLDNGYVAPSAYSDPNIICHKSATPGQTSAKIAAGDVVELQWTTWPESHHGPVIDYLAKCDGKCEEVDKTTLEFFKISQGGLVDDSAVPGTWASDQLIANNNSWSVTIPTSIAPGNYVLRHEIIALHSAGQADGAQNYPQCINLEITGSGTDTPAGTLGTALYKEDDPGVLVNIYQSMASYTIPGPALYTGAVSMEQGAGSGSAAASSVAASTTAPAVGAISTPTASASSSFKFYSNSTATASSYAAPTSSAAAVSSSAAPATSAAAVSSAAPVASSSSYAAPTTCRTTIYTSKPSSTSAANALSAASASSVSYAAAPSSTSAPAPSASSSAPTTSESAPSLPSGYSLDDLISTVTYYLKAGWKASGNGNAKREHARAFK